MAPIKKKILLGLFDNYFHSMWEHTNTIQELVREVAYSARSRNSDLWPSNTQIQDPKHCNQQMCEENSVVGS
jgi:hypothetical protein